MAEGFEPYHVPQQSRREKLRVVAQNHPACFESTAVALSASSGFLPFYDPSLLSSDLLTATAGGSHGFHHQTGKNSTICVVKEGVNFMGFVNGSSSSSSSTYHPYLNSPASLPLNPSTIQDMDNNNNNNPFLYAPQSLQNLRDLDHSSYNNAAEVVVYKPKPSATGQGLSLSLSSQNTHRNNLLMGLNLQSYDSAVYNDKVTPTGYVASTSNEVSRSSVPLGPFTGYASILKGSRFLRPAQQLLEELCDVGGGSYVEKITPDSCLMESPLQNLSAAAIIDESLGVGDGGESGGKKSRLISMLDEVLENAIYVFPSICP
ncbi:hypothetical protein HRI_003718600 [Hibiscus trionum]|uniref:POX domain-containing protein n=1 Tax=Hibiscus trionum TaxID=183268 RepID=A0A9W7IV17_HIBTR|nr:hypothetical protein HRI_003718600 [Hibiscus trionum]